MGIDEYLQVFSSTSDLDVGLFDRHQQRSTLYVFTETYHGGDPLEGGRVYGDRPDAHADVVTSILYVVGVLISDRV